MFINSALELTDDTAVCGVVYHDGLYTQSILYGFTFTEDSVYYQVMPTECVHALIYETVRGF